MATSTSEGVKFLVIQYGARHGYAVPSAFARVGALSCLYTDITAQDRLAPLVGLVSKLSSSSLGRNALARRTLPEELEKLTRSFGGSYLIGDLFKRLSNYDKNIGRAEKISRQLIEFEMKCAGTQDATHLYTMLGEGGQFVVEAKSRGLRVVGDVYIALSADAIVSEEMRRFSDWCDASPPETRVGDARTSNHTLLDCSDLLVCPSDFVLEDLIVNHGVDREKCVVAPYAVDQRWFLLECDPIPRRVLFAGSAIVRKGIHYLAMAAERLAPYGYKFVVAGGATPLVRNHPNATALEFCGQLQSSELGEQLRRADVFAFPTLAEGAASAVAEALGAGVPVVTTRAAGSIVRDGVEGFIVPERDPIALAQAIQTISEDRNLRARMSEAAKIRAASFTWDHFSTTVLSAVQ